MCAFYGNPETMGALLPPESHQFFQLHLCPISAMCVIGTISIFSFYSDDESPEKAFKYGCDLETIMRTFGLGIYCFAELVLVGVRKIFDVVVQRLKYIFRIYISLCLI